MSNIGNALLSTTSDKIDDRDAKIEELERKLHAQQVEEGRLKKVSEDLKEARKRISELENFNAIEHGRDIKLPQEADDVMSDDLRDGTATIANSFAKTYTDRLSEKIDRRNDDFEKRFAKIEQDNMRRGQDEMERTINSKYPGFLSSIMQGGSLHEAWQGYLKYNLGSVQNALNRFDTPALCYHIKNFFSEAGINASSLSKTGNSSTAPDPKNVGGQNINVNDFSQGRTYTLDEFARLTDEAEKLRFSNPKRFQKIYEELTNAVSEGRIKEK